MKESLYNDGIKNLARDQLGHGRFLSPTVSARLDNVLCGDRVEIDVVLKNNRVVDLAHRVKGCLLCKAAASIVSVNAMGVNLDEIADAIKALTLLAEDGSLVSSKWDQLNLFSPVRFYKSRLSCILLPFQALEDALRQDVSYLNDL